MNFLEGARRLRLVLMALWILGVPFGYVKEWDYRVSQIDDNLILCMGCGDEEYQKQKSSYINKQKWEISKPMIRSIVIWWIIGACGIEFMWRSSQWVCRGFVANKPSDQ